MSTTVQAPSRGSLRDFLMQQEPYLAEAANETWKAAEDIHARQTEKLANVNGLRHVEKVETNIWRLLNETTDRSLKRNLERFSNVDLSLLSCAACCHDLDKGLDDKLLAENFIHGGGSADFVCKQWESLKILSQAAAIAIATIVSIHDCKADFDSKVQELKTDWPVEDKSVNLQILATLLKVADTLHSDESRISRVPVPDDSLQGFDRLKQLARSSGLGWGPDGRRIVLTVLMHGGETANAVQDMIDYIVAVEWPPISRNLQAHQFPHEIEFRWEPLPSFGRDSTGKSRRPFHDKHEVSERLASEMRTAEPVTFAPLRSDEPLRLVAVPPDKLAEYLAQAGPLSVIDNSYIQPQLTELGVSPGAVNRIFVGPANCGKTRAAYEWICDRVGLDPHSWVVLRPESGSIPQDASKFIIDFHRFYDVYGRTRPHKAILFADDLPDYLPPPGSGSAASEAVHRLLGWFRQYPGFQERRFTGTIRSERTHDKSDWPDRLAELGSLRLLRVEPLNDDQRRDLWRGISQGRSFRNQVFEKLNVEIDESFLEAVATIEADPEAIAYYIRAMAEQGKDRIEETDAASFGTDVAKIWIELTWPTIRETYGTAACVFLTLARFIEASARPNSGFEKRLVPAWEYHSVFGPPLLSDNGGNGTDYLPAVKRMLEDGHASGVDREWVRPRFDFLLQARKLKEIELPLPPSSWFASHANGLSPFRQTSIAFHLSCARQPCADEGVSVHWLLGQALAMEFMATNDTKNAPSWDSQAVAICDELIRRFGSDGAPDVREQIAKAFVFKGLSLQHQHMLDNAVKTYDELVSRFGNENTLAIREQVVLGLVNKGIAHGRLGEYQQALGTFGKLFGDNETPTEREDVPALLNARSGLGTDEKALGPCAELSKRFGDELFARVKEHLAEALFYKGIALGSMDRLDEALAPFGLLANCFGDNTIPFVRDKVATGLVLKGRLLGTRGRHDEAVAAFEELQRLFGMDERLSVREQIATGLYYSTGNYIGMWHSSKDERLLDKAISKGREAVRMGAGCYNLACALALEGKLSDAFELLKDALGKREIPWSHVAQDPDWESLRDDPWYKGLEAKYSSESHGTGQAAPEEV
jgi:tetratricopeptide (TPR) repeat protein